MTQLKKPITLQHIALWCLLIASQILKYKKWLEMQWKWRPFYRNKGNKHLLGMCSEAVMPFEEACQFSIWGLELKHCFCLHCLKSKQFISTWHGHSTTTKRRSAIMCIGSERQEASRRGNLPSETIIPCSKCGKGSCRSQCHNEHDVWILMWKMLWKLARKLCFKHCNLGY